MTQSSGRFTTYATAEIRAEMARQRLYNKDLAARIGVTPPTMSRYLSGQIPLTLDDLESIAEALGVGLQRFIPAPELAATGTDGAPGSATTHRDRSGVPVNIRWFSSLADARAERAHPTAPEADAVVIPFTALTCDDDALREDQSQAV